MSKTKIAQRKGNNTANKNKKKKNEDKTTRKEKTK